MLFPRSRSNRPGAPTDKTTTEATGNNTGDATGDANRANTRNNAGDNTGDATRDATGDNIRDNTGSNTRNATGDNIGNAIDVTEGTETTQETNTPQAPEDPMEIATCENSANAPNFDKEILKIVVLYTMQANNTEGAVVETVEHQQPENDEEYTKEDMVQAEPEKKVPTDVELKDLVIANPQVVGEDEILGDQEFMEEPEDDDDDEEEEE